MFGFNGGKEIPRVFCALAWQFRDLSDEPYFRLRAMMVRCSQPIALESFREAFQIDEVGPKFRVIHNLVRVRTRLRTI
jgi:hypothetical protein